MSTLTYTNVYTQVRKKKCDYNSILAHRSAYLVEEVDPLAEREKDKKWLFNQKLCNFP